MAVTLAQLLAAPSVAQARDFVLALLETGGFPVASWQSGSFGRRYAEVSARQLSDGLALVARIASGGFVDTAEGEWLTLLARGAYGLERHAAVFARGPARLTDVAGAGPHTIASRSLWATSLSGHRFTNVTGGTLAQNGTLTLTWEAESPGSGHNIAANTLTQLATTLPGVTITNPPARLGSAAWLTQTGTDAEADDALRIRCRARWPSLGSGATALVYEGWVRTASPEVVKVKVFGNTPANGQVSIVVAGAAGPLSNAAVTAIDAYVDLRAPLCVLATVSSATAVAVNVQATLVVRAAYRNSAQAQALANLAAYQAELAIGETVYRAALIERLMAVDGAVNATVSLPAADVALGTTSIATLAPTLSVVAV